MTEQQERYEVVETWANADSVKEKVICEGFESKEKAQAYAADIQASRHFPWSAFVVRRERP